MKKPEKKEDLFINYDSKTCCLGHTQDVFLNRGYNQAIDNYEKFLPSETELRKIYTDEIGMYVGAMDKFECRAIKAIAKRIGVRGNE